jgi:hypothetical protein
MADPGVQINPDEFPSLARLIVFSADVDAYLEDLGIDTADLRDDGGVG